MLAELKFVQGAVAKKDLLPALTHFRIESGTVRSFNGSLALCSPIAFDIDCTPKAIPFVKAIQNCKETVTMSMTPAGRLSVKSGTFKAFIECIEEGQPIAHTAPEGEEFDINGEAFLAAIQAVSPFVGDDASRPWSNGILFKGQSAYATNNITIIEYWVGSSFPFTFNVPREAIREILRVGEAPIGAQATKDSLTLHYNDGKWIRTQLLKINWPDINKVLDVECNPVELNDIIFEALETIKPFTDNFGRVYMHDSSISTTLIDGEGASFGIEGFEYDGVYQIEMLKLLKGVAKTIDWSLYPKPCIFYGDRLRGAIVGMRI